MTPRLTLDQLDVMGALALDGDDLTVGEIARAAALTPERTRAVLDELRGAGLVSGPHAQDDEPTWLLTPRGEDAFRALINEGEER
jgi:DNA-binding MarR family transcriptional regulator